MSYLAQTDAPPAPEDDSYRKENKNGIPDDKIKNMTDKYEVPITIASEEYMKHPPEK